MCFGTGDFISILALAIKVQTAYEDAPDNYRHISKEVLALRILIEKTAQHFKSTSISSDNLHDGQKVLKGCQSVLQNLNAFIGKYRKRASMNERLDFMGFKLGKEDIMTLQEKLILNTGLLNGFVQRFVVPGILLYFTNPLNINFVI